MEKTSECVLIVMKYANGDTFQLTGENAESLHRWLDRVVDLASRHGADYHGPKMELVKK